jgi:hypothetical protein
MHQRTFAHQQRLLLQQKSRLTMPLQRWKPLREESVPLQSRMRAARQKLRIVQKENAQS